METPLGCPHFKIHNRERGERKKLFLFIEPLQFCNILSDASNLDPGETVKDGDNGKNCHNVVKKDSAFFVLSLGYFNFQQTFLTSLMAAFQVESTKHFVLTLLSINLMQSSANFLKIEFCFYHHVTLLSRASLTRASILIIMTRSSFVLVGPG